MLEQCGNYSKQCGNNFATLCCAKTRRCESSRVTSPYKQQRRRRLRKRHVHVKKWIRAASNFIALIPSRLISQMLAIFLELNSERLHQSSGKEKESCCFVFLSSTKRGISHFHIVVVQRRQRNVQKSVMNVQSCCFANINLLLFCRSCCRRRRRCLSSLLLSAPRGWRTLPCGLN